MKAQELVPPVHCGRWMHPTANSTSHRAEWKCLSCDAIEERVGVCDFCSDSHPIINEPARDFEVQPGPVGISSGDWGACQECHDLIVAEKWLELEDRAVRAMRLRYPDRPKRQVQLAVQAIQRQFRIHRA